MTEFNSGNESGWIAHERWPMTGPDALAQYARRMLSERSIKRLVHAAHRHTQAGNLELAEKILGAAEHHIEILADEADDPDLLFLLAGIARSMLEKAKFREFSEVSVFDTQMAVDPEPPWHGG